MTQISKMDAPVLSWVIPVYNGAQYIGQAIESILRQPCKDFEIIVVNDGSTDNTLDVVNSIPCNCLRVINKENGGVSSARNAGIRSANSNYIAFLDADDVLCKEVFDDAIHTILCSEKYDVISFSYYLGDQELHRGKRISVIDGDVGSNAAELYLYKHFSSFIFHKHVFMGEPGLKFPEGFRVNEDVTLLYLICQHTNKIRNIDKNCFVYRNNIDSVMHQNKELEYLQSDMIPVWNWCKKRCRSESAKEQCDARIFALAVQYICLCCEAGKPLDEANQILNHPAVKEALMNYSILWNSSKEEYELFLNYPRMYWIKKELAVYLVKYLHCWHMCQSSVKCICLSNCVKISDPSYRKYRSQHMRSTSCFS